jgi:hypothetical protein
VLDYTTLKAKLVKIKEDIIEVEAKGKISKNKGRYNRSA